MMAQPFAHPSGMPGHTGLPHGHAMGHGHPVNQGIPGGQPGATMAQQMHGMGAAPQASQAPMMGMPQGGAPGGGPSAHAMSHLNPNVNQQIYQQQQQMQRALAQAEPGFQQRLQQQQQQQQQQTHHQLIQRQLMQQQQLGQHQAGQMVMNPNAANMNLIGQFRPQVNLSANLQQQLTNHQQHAHAQYVAQQQQMQQQMMQQQQQHQQQQHHPQAASQPTSAPGQTAMPHPPIRPPSAMQAGADPQTANAIQGPHTAQAPGQQNQQAQQAQAAQQQAQSQQPGPQQPNQQPQNSQQQTQQPPQNQGTPQPQNPPQPPQQAQQQPQAPQQGQRQPDSAAQQAHRQAMQVHAQAQAAQQAYQAQSLAMRMSRLNGASILKLLQFGDDLGPHRGQGSHNEIYYWKDFVGRFFSDTGVLRQQLWSSAEQGSKTFELSTPVLPRYFWTYYHNGVQNIQMIMENATEKDLPGGGNLVECRKCTFIYWYPNRHQVVATGSLTAQFGQQGKMEMLEISVSEHNEYVLRSKLLTQPESPEQKPSPSALKASGKKAQNQRMRQIQAPEQPSPSIPKQAVNEWGVHPSVLVLLEISETFSNMEPLFQHSRSHPDISPQESLRNLVTSYNAQSFAQNAETTAAFNPSLAQQTPGGQRTPGGQQAFANGPQAQPPGQQFASPAPGAHLNLPGTTASPANMNMSPAMHAHGLQGAGGGPTSVGMVAQASQQGSATGSQGTSANASPNVTNKRRRASGINVKSEMDAEGGGGGVTGPEVNGAKVKQSPRPNAKRQKP